MYTNIDRVSSSRLEVRDQLKKKKPMIVCLAETTQCETIEIDLDNNYNVRRKDRVSKGGGGVMIMTRKELLVKQVLYGEGKAKVMSIKVENGNKEMVIIVAYVTPKTSSQSSQDHEGLIQDTLLSLSKMIKGRRRVILTGDFSSKKVNQENYESGSGETVWGKDF